MTETYQPHDLLPGASTPLQVTLSLVDDARAWAMHGFPRFGVLLSPLDCPAVMLPYLAYQRSVRVWDSAWPESVKRQVIASAYEVHRHNGTVKAVKTALSALGINASVTEWWQTRPRGFPYTFLVETFASIALYGENEGLITPRMARAIEATIIATKPETRSFTFEVAVLANGALGMLGAFIAERFRTLDLTWLEPEADGHAGLAAAFAVRRDILFSGVP